MALSPTVPTDIPGGLSGSDTLTTQQSVEAFAWQEFVALGWPAQKGKRGEADASKPLADEGPKVWETWKTPEEIYLPGGAEPLPWDAPLPRERSLTDNLQAIQSDGTLPATLTDRYGHVVRYEIRFNKVLFDYLRSHKLYDSRQQSLAESISFPDGAMMVKASWRELEPGEEAHYLTRECVVFDTKNGKPGRKRKRTMGLVGLHLVQKTPSAPQWVWATFEHTGNVEGTDPSFALSRRLRLSARLRQLNHTQQQALHAAGSVLQNYELAGAQWPVSGSEGRVEPTFVSNTTMESFVQESSCLGCHASARTLRSDRFVASDFVYSLRRAQPSVIESPKIAAPTKPVTEWDKKNWKAIQRGHALSEHTYELLPKFVGNKLHCSSCHLDVGRNLSSSPWIGMFAEGKYDTPQKFYDRINQCMQRSMNGKPLPRDSAEMIAMAAYIRSLGGLKEAMGAAQRKAHEPVAFKTPNRAADLKGGKKVFDARCAACHGSDGSGLRASANPIQGYVFPPLWGPDSFNDGAGMHRVLTAARFVKARTHACVKVSKNQWPQP